MKGFDFYVPPHMYFGASSLVELTRGDVVLMYKESLQA